jgi:tRNA pseudouridine38-40 synthase
MSPEDNFCLLIQYDGRPFVGWQRQKNGLSVQECLEDACLRIIGRRCAAHGASRTDSGVHAAGQVASIRMRTKLSARALKKALNALLPPEIRILSSRRVPYEFHAQNDAVQKTYRYLVLCAPIRSPFAPYYAAWIPYPLSLEPMREAADCLVGKHDFRSFMGRGSSIKSTVRTLKNVEIKRGGGMISYYFTADGFLKQMVRILVGTLIEVGRGKIGPEQAAAILAAGDRRSAGPTAPPEGLTLMGIEY